MEDGVRATRERLVVAAIELFAEQGFEGASIREICRRAHTNIAAVNYHFRDKLGLYLEVVQSAIDHMRDTSDLTKRVPPGSSAEQRFRHYVQTYVDRLMTMDGPTSWIHRLMRHEMTEPTPAAVQIFKFAILPRLEYLATLIAELMGCQPDDPRVRLCVASVQAQCLFFRPDPFREAIAAEWPAATEIPEALAEHISEFSLAAIRELAGRRMEGDG
jgi:AcrR family transcriptional regulator